jgi:hypothetical protein
MACQPSRVVDGRRGQRGSFVDVGQCRDRRQPLADRARQRGGIAFVEHGGGVDTRHPAQVGDRVDDHVEIFAPVVVRGDQDLAAPGSIGQHRRIVGVPVHHILSAVDHGQVGGAEQLVGSRVVGGEVHRVLRPKSGLSQRLYEAVRGERLAP